jgi:hypothetical protein
MIFQILMISHFDMSAKDKAKELFEKYKIFVLCQSSWGEYDDHVEKENAKKCALIAVDEILNSSISVFWNEVKKEISLL